MIPDRPEFHLLRCGPLAARRLARDSCGRVAAVFARAFYVALDAELISVGPSDFDMGPLNAASTAAAQCDWRAAGLRPGMTASLHQGRLAIAGGPVFDGTSAELWQPRPPAVSWADVSLYRAIRSFDHLAAKLAPSDGFGPLLKRASPDRPTALVTRAARPQIERLERWLGSCFADCPTEDGPPDGPPEGAIERLLGLGPGLTPSGDDYLAGLMIALHGLGQGQPLEALSAVVRRSAPSRTSAISCAHLGAAAEGLGGEALHALLHALLGEGDLPPALRAIDDVGHSSGWDGAAGLVSVLRAKLSAGERAALPAAVG